MEQHDPVSTTSSEATQPSRSADTDARAEKSAGFMATRKEKAIALIQSGESIDKVVSELSLPESVLEGWLSPNRPWLDRRRWYDDGFKAEALRQLAKGKSVRQLAKELDVTEVTLHKWRKQAHTPSMNEVGEVDVRQLREQLRALMQERDTLKQALLIFLRAS